MDKIGQALPPSLTEPPEKPKGAQGSMGKDDFMKLLMAQLSNQDPLKPMDHQEFSAQLAQFSQLEQLTNINKNIDGLHAGFGNEAKLQAVGMIGKKVQATSNEVELVKGETALINNSLPEDVKPTKLSIYGLDGQLVRTIDLTGKNAKELVWDGKDDAGTSLPSGKYRFNVHGVGPSGEPREGTSSIEGVVTGVQMEGKNPVLMLETKTGKQKIEWAKVGEVSVNNEAPPPTKNSMSAAAGVKPAAALMDPNAASNQGAMQGIPQSLIDQVQNLQAEKGASPEGSPMGDDFQRSPTISEVPWEQLVQTSPVPNLRP